MIFQYVQENKKYYFGKKNCIYLYIYVIIHIHIRSMAGKYLSCICCTTPYEPCEKKCPNKNCGYSNQFYAFYSPPCETKVEADKEADRVSAGEPDVVLAAAMDVGVVYAD